MLNLGKFLKRYGVENLNKKVKIYASIKYEMFIVYVLIYLNLIFKYNNKIYSILIKNIIVFLILYFY